MSIFMQLIVSGISVGMIYGVIAFGYQLTFATSKTLNFGQGEALMIGALVGLTTIRDYDEYTFTHSVNVCIFSVALGKKLGFSKLQLYDLGMTALLHDVVEDTEVTIEPRVQQRPAVHLDGQLLPTDRTGVRSRLEPKAGRVGVGTDDPELLAGMAHLPVDRGDAAEDEERDRGDASSHTSSGSG